MTKQYITTTLEEDDDTSPYHNLKDYVKHLTDLLNDVPVEFQNSVTIDYQVGVEEGYGGYSEATLEMNIEYRREETDEEYYERMNFHQLQQERNKARNEQRERDEYERLQKKFG